MNYFYDGLFLIINIDSYYIYKTKGYENYPKKSFSSH